MEVDIMIGVLEKMLETQNYLTRYFWREGEVVSPPCLVAAAVLVENSSLWALTAATGAVRKSMLKTRGTTSSAMMIHSESVASTTISRRGSRVAV